MPRTPTFPLQLRSRWEKQRLTPPRPWAPMNHDEWAAIAPFLHRAGHLPGRRLADARQRIDAIFLICRTGLPWRDLPAAYGKPDTVARHFRRLTHAGLWQKLLQHLASDLASKPLLAMEHWICRACRRATRILGLVMVMLARQLRFDSALRAPHWLLPDPVLSAWCVWQTLLPGFFQEARRKPLRDNPISLIRRGLDIAKGRQRIPKCLEPA